MTRIAAAASLMRMAGSTYRSNRVTKKSPSVGLLDAVRKEMAEVRHGPPSWWERVAPEHLAELSAIKAAWQSGELGTRKKTLARTISNNLRARGISDIGTQGVLTWLDVA
jgi:hypothetical protein